MAQQAIKEMMRNSRESVKYLKKKEHDWKNPSTRNDTGKKQGPQEEEEEAMIKNHERNAQS